MGSQLCDIHSDQQKSEIDLKQVSQLPMSKVNPPLSVIEQVSQNQCQDKYSSIMRESNFNRNVSYLIRQLQPFSSQTDRSFMIVHRPPFGTYEVQTLNNDQPQGFGKLYYLDGRIFHGNFKDGLFHGKGRFYFTNKSYYQGEFKGGKIEGYGKYYDQSTDYFYEGFWVGNRQDGEGVQRTPAYQFQGKFKEGKKNGKGKITFQNNQYQGMFLDDFISGKGKFNTNSYSYEGDWILGKPSGKGLSLWTDSGDSYLGDYKQGKKQGYGVYLSPRSKAKIEGGWLNGRREGECSTSVDEMQQKGLYKNGVLVQI